MDALNHLRLIGTVNSQLMGVHKCLERGEQIFNGSFVTILPEPGNEFGIVFSSIRSYIFGFIYVHRAYI